MIQQVAIDLRSPAQHESCARIWSSACGEDLAISPSFVEYNFRPTTGILKRGWIAMEESREAGFIMASCDPGENLGWINAIAVVPALQCRGIGNLLFNWAESWLTGLGCRRVRLGGSLRPFTPGLPVELERVEFFRKREYQTYPAGPFVWDLARCLTDYASLCQPPGNCRLCTAGAAQVEALSAFLQAEFPGRWHFEFVEHLRESGRVSDYLLLMEQGQIIGFCQVTLEDSIRPLNLYYPQRLPHPWGQLGSVGIASNYRGRGYGSQLLDLSLMHLKNLGVDGCVIDWTGLLDLYGKFGFTPFRQYWSMEKTL